MIDFLKFVRKDEKCWVWTGTKQYTHKNSYGVFKGRLAHRVAYELWVGIIPSKKVIDHLCRNGLCVNPEHLEVVSNIENILRGNGAPAVNARKKICKRGHKLIVSNLWKRKDGRRACRKCDLQNPTIRDTVTGKRTRLSRKGLAR